MGLMSEHKDNLRIMNAIDQFLTRTESRRVRCLDDLDSQGQSALGQFFTPDAAARLIASIPRLPREGTLRILDPGAGSGSLTAALLSRVISEAPHLSVELVAVEFDEQVARMLVETLSDCEDVAQDAGVNIQTKLVVGDYIEISSELGDDFDIVIMNPPYGKMAARSHNRSLMATRGVDTPNLYAAFMALGVANLTDEGQLVAITPRSFANGVYFEQFRNFFLDQISIDRIHIFESRSTVFSDTGVLQENIIVSGTRFGDREHVELSVSTGHEDAVTSRIVSYSEIVRPDDPARFVRIPALNNDAQIVEQMLGLPATLADLGINVSTGRVVDFRKRDKLIDHPAPEHFPMVYSSNLKAGTVRHPLQGNKPQFFSAIELNDTKLLVPEGIYVVIKRFSAKEERRRIVAGIWSPSENGTGPIAIDNKLNYVHCFGEGLNRDLAVGLSFWLNSTIVDVFFRTFSGHTQVNATDLRSMRFPSLEVLQKIGRENGTELPEQDEIDRIINAVFDQIWIAA